MAAEPDLALTVPAGLVEAVAQRTADLVAERMSLAPQATSPLLTADEAAIYLRASRQRLYDLVGERRLTPCRDGRRLLFHRDDLAAYLRAGTRDARDDIPGVSLALSATASPAADGSSEP